MNTEIEDYKRNIEVYNDFLIKENQRLLAEIEKLNRNLQQYREAVEYFGYSLLELEEN
jgi:hypothetical protein